MNRTTNFVFASIAVMTSLLGGVPMIFASSTVPASKIMGFYGSTLAQLGWDGDNGIWIRGEEKLVIGAVETARGPLWRLMLQPK